MSVVIRCPHCAAQFRVNEGAAGHRAVCKRCKLDFTIPALQSKLPEGEDRKDSRENRRTLKISAIGILTALLCVTGILAYDRWNSGWERDHRSAIIDLNSRAEDEVQKGDNESAKRDYDSILTLANGNRISSDDIQNIVSAASIKARNLSRKSRSSAEIESSPLRSPLVKAMSIPGAIDRRKPFPQLPKLT